MIHAFLSRLSGRNDLSIFGQIVLLIRIPVTVGLCVMVLLQLGAAFQPIIKPEQLNLPDLIPPLNTAVLALLWWRVSQLEKAREYFQDRLDRARDIQDADRAEQRRRHDDE